MVQQYMVLKVVLALEFSVVTCIWLEGTVQSQSKVNNNTVFKVAKLEWQRANAIKTCVVCATRACMQHVKGSDV